MLKTYIGTKIVQAAPLPAPLDHPQAGAEGYRVVYPDGYESWSPKTTFDACNRLVTEEEAAIVAVPKAPAG